MEYEVMDQEVETAPPEPPAPKEKKPFPLKKLLKKITVKRAVLLVLVLGVGGYVILKALTPTPEVIIPHRVAALERIDLRNTVDITGNIESETAAQVYTTLSEPVLEVPVEVGDTVEEGDLLCQLDTTSLEADIKSKEASMWSTASNNNLSIKQAQDELNTARAYYEKGEDASILKAQSTLEEAERNLRSAEFDLRSAEQSLYAARRENKDAEKDGADPIYDQDSLNSYRNAVAKANLSVESAEAALAEAERALERSESDALLELKSLEEAVTRAKNTANQGSDYISLESLKEDLAKCTVTAPVSGTVTAVYAKEGDKGTGLLFVIEDPDALVADSSVMEYDVNNVKPGQKVEIKSDATGDEVFLGEVLSVSPASIKDDSGKTVTGSTAAFAVKIKVLDRDSGLRIGMNVRISVITEEKPASMAVLYDAVALHPETGEPVVFVAVPNERASADGEPDPSIPSHVVKMIPVETGMETDLYWEISSPELSEGDLILQDSEGLVDGMEIHISDPNDLYGMGEMGPMGGGMMGGGVTVAVG